MGPKKRKDGPESDGKRRKKPKKTEDSESDFESDEEVQDIPEEPEPEPDAGQNHDDFALPAPKTSGTLLISGGTNWDLVGRSKVPKGTKNGGGPNLLAPHIVEAIKETRIRSVVSGCCAVHSVIMDIEGNAYTWGRNDKSQLGHGDIERRDTPLLVDSLSGLRIVSAACGKNHTLFLAEKGHVYSVGDNRMGQLGLGNQGNSVMSTTKIRYSGPPIARVAAGSEFSMISDIRGNLYSFGSPEYGQLGHNTDGKYFATSNKLAHSCELKPRKVSVFIERSREGHISPVIDVEVEDVACGVNHTVALDRKKRVFTWGFGGYGRLGHTDQKDEYVPRLVKLFEGPNRGAVSITAGSSFTMAVNELGALYLWGKNKPTGEAAMYPKPVNDLSGWAIRSMSCCNTSIILAADESVVSWGSGTTYGELGYGENKPKSSTTPQEVKPLDGVYIHEVAGGYGHSLFIARVDSDDDKKNLEKIAMFKPLPAPN